ncbi:hypothetical protein LQF59_09225 [Tetragenococcus koreensis]|uniref:hypothetical protein n=1 Tax=Tetragenococcus koreensis TaxID=290335 RepID=UPI001F37E3BE|nr:hypothetical protein [Tetragenococcus koreensis]MCF1615239.1 hypothetical protein [Tetragenococcus koreensis]MCF1625005.1 hypothetical protein [Tetragenococcus koreensis]MCF1627722.1 hypothetical protein [Tetragenococcus koreensis]MCF1678157.1 hypothetical protein [Tetragenococcus koreensis]
MKKKQISSIEFFDEIYKLECKSHETLSLKGIFGMVLADLLLPYFLSNITTGSIYVSVSLGLLIIICITPLAQVLFYAKKYGNREGSKKYRDTLFNKLKDNGVSKASEISQLIKEISCLLDKYEAQRNAVAKGFIEFSKILIIPIALVVYKFLTFTMALFIFISLFVLSIEILFFYWQDFDIMKTIGTKNYYKYINVKPQLNQFHNSLPC